VSDQFIGEIRLFGFSRIPDNWVACNGQALPISQFSALFQLIGTTYGGDGVQTFNVPDLRGRVPISQGNGQGLTPRILGQASGEENHTLLEQEMPSHSHGLVSTTNTGTTATPGTTVHLATSNNANQKVYAPQANVPSYDVLAPSIALSGSSLPHDNMMPTLTGNFCIAVFGIFPSQG
jgi:microcystin-dependent protein